MLSSHLLLTKLDYQLIVYETKEFIRDSSRPATDLVLNYGITESQC